MDSRDPIRLDSQESVANGWFGVGDAGSVPARRSERESMSPSLVERAEGGAASQSRAWWRRGLRMARDAAIGLTILAAVPFAIIGTRGEAALLRDVSGVSQRIAEVEHLRPLMVARDAAFTPADAGTLLHRLEPVKSPPGFPMHAAGATPARPWDAEMGDLFAGLRGGGNDGALAAGIVTAAAGGFSAQEMAYLRAVAEAPVWRDVERLASAPAVDVIGGRFVLPFKSDVQAYAMPVMRFVNTKQLAYAGVSRAAYYVAIGQPDAAEAALKTVVSYGFMLVDNGSHVLDALIGRVVIGIGQNGLHQLYSLTRNEHGMALTVPITRGTGQASASTRGDVDADVAISQMLRTANDPAVPRTVRLEALHGLAFSSCSSVGGVLRGPSAAVQEAFAKARDDLARYPSERALLDLMYSSVDRLTSDGSPSGIGARVVMGAATATSAMLGNPRVAACTRIVLSN